MKKFIIDFFRNSPISTGLLLLLISCHFTGIKDLTTSWLKSPEVFWDIIIVYLIVTYAFISWWRPTIDKEKRERATWVVIFTSVIVLTILAKFFAP